MPKSQRIRVRKTILSEPLSNLYRHLEGLTDEQIDNADDAGFHDESQWVWDLRSMVEDGKGDLLKKKFDTLYEQMSVRLLECEDFKPIFLCMKKQHQVLYID
ncbi:hypothetical protein [Vibrio owensii]|uniref:hypothetical protein n=1 Tax=Vibrio owensii TaxID=696485 RepID=UPI0018F16309|nr:hypothetical protein [Vibrio owensii]